MQTYGNDEAKKLANQIYYILRTASNSGNLILRNKQYKLPYLISKNSVKYNINNIMKWIKTESVRSLQNECSTCFYIVNIL